MMSLKEAQEKYEIALEKYNKSHSTKDWERLIDAQEQIDRAMTKWFKQTEEQQG